MSEPDERIRYLGELTKLEVGPNDMIVLHVDQHLSQEQQGIVAQQMEKAFGPGRCVVVTKGMKLGVLSMLPQSASASQ